MSSQHDTSVEPDSPVDLQSAEAASLAGESSPAVTTSGEVPGPEKPDAAQKSSQTHQAVVAAAAPKDSGSTVVGTDPRSAQDAVFSAVLAAAGNNESSASKTPPEPVKAADAQSDYESNESVTTAPVVDDPGQQSAGPASAVGPESTEGVVAPLPAKEISEPGARVAQVGNERSGVSEAQVKKKNAVSAEDESAVARNSDADPVTGASDPAGGWASPDDLAAWFLTSRSNLATQASSPAAAKGLEASEGKQAHKTGKKPDEPSISPADASSASTSAAAPTSVRPVTSSSGSTSISAPTTPKAKAQLPVTSSEAARSQAPVSQPSIPKSGIVPPTASEPVEPVAAQTRPIDLTTLRAEMRREDEAAEQAKVEQAPSAEQAKATPNQPVTPVPSAEQSKVAEKSTSTEHSQPAEPPSAGVQVPVRQAPPAPPSVSRPSPPSAPVTPPPVVSAARRVPPPPPVPAPIAGTGVKESQPRVTPGALSPSSSVGPKSDLPQVEFAGQNPFPQQRKPADQRSWQRPLRWAAIAVGVVLVVGMVTAFATAGKVPRNVTVAGVPIGGMSRDEAVAAVRKAADQSAGELTLKVDARLPGQDSDSQNFKPVSLDTNAAGFNAKSVNAAASVDAVMGSTFSPARLWAMVAGGGNHPVLPGPDEKDLSEQVTRTAAQLNQELVEGAIIFDANGPRTRAPIPGIKVDIPGAVESVKNNWLSPGHQVTVPAEVKASAVTQADLDAAMPQARQLVSGPLTLVYNDQSIVMQPAALMPALSMQATGEHKLELMVDENAIYNAVAAVTKGKVRQPMDAKIVLRNGKPEIVPAQDGVKVNGSGLADSVKKALQSQDRTAKVTVTAAPAAFTTQDAEKLRVVEQVSRFSTNLTSSPVRTNNLRVAAKTINGMLVKPGETFSLNKALGKRTKEKGYGQAPMILGDELELSYGGGVSQMATTVYNNVFFAGLKDIKHQPHSFYISRYPEGREATIDFDSGIDLVWQNDSPYGVLIEANVNSTVNVAFWSTKVYEVKEGKSERRNVTQPPPTRYKSGKDCVAQSPNSGFTVTVYRDMTKDGVAMPRQSWTTVYQPEPGVVCGPSPSSSSSPTKPAPSAPTTNIPMPRRSPL